MKNSAYPDPLQVLEFKLSIGERISCAWETRKIRARRLREGRSGVEIFPLRGDVRLLSQDDLPLVVLMHNDRRFVPSFLKHYRGLGVTRFLCLDDQSSDGTREMLMAEPDVDVFGSNVRYRDARRGRLWREALLAAHGAERWYLNVDSDEYIVFEACEQRSLQDLIGALERRGIDRCPAPMIDAYPAGVLEEADFDGSSDAMPWQVAPMFDGNGYSIAKEKRALTIRGGMRSRVFNADVELIKYPLLYWRDGYSLGISIHQPLPFEKNFAPIFGALLHFKFFSDIGEVAREAVSDSQYFDGAREYKKIVSAVENSGGSFSVSCNDSVCYRDSRDLVDRGFIAPIFT